MTEYIVLRENFQAYSWELVGQVSAEDENRAVRQLVAPPDSNPFGLFAAIPNDEFNDFIRGRPLVHISASVQVMEPTSTTASSA